MNQQVTIDGTIIKLPPLGPGIESYNLTKSGRVASGKMKMDLVAKKRKLTFDYPTISSTDKKVIMNLIDGSKMFFTVTWIEDNETKTAKMYVGQITRGLLRTGSAEWYWKDFKYDLIEQ